MPPVAQPADRPLSLADLEQVYRQHWRRLHAIARRIVGPIEADAVIQEVFVALLHDELRARFVGGDLGAWLGEIARRKALQQLERRGREQPTEAVEREGASPEEDLAARDLVRRFQERHVPEGQRRFFELRFLERRTQVETAALLNVPRSTLEGWEHKLSRALRAFVLGGKLMGHLLGQWTLDRYFAGGVGRRGQARLRAHLDGCGRCRDRYRRHLVLESLLPDGDRRDEERLWRSIRGATAARPRGRWALALLAAAALLLLVPRLRAPSPVARGGGPALSAAPAIHLFRVESPGRATPVDGRLSMGQGLVLAYSNPGQVYDHLMVFAVDQGFRVHWFYPAYQRPEEDPEAIAIVRGRSGVELGEEIRLPVAPGPLRVYALFLDHAARVSQIEALVETTLARPNHPIDREVRLPVDGFQLSRLLEVMP